MIDWNGNGKIDPVDIGISIATENDANDDEQTNTSANEKENKEKPQSAGCLTAIVLALMISAIILCAILFMGG